MRVAIGSDHGGFELKQKIVKTLKEKGFDVIDFGTDSNAPVDYPDYAKKIAHGVRSDEVDFGIALCGTGIGISIALNKFKGIRAALVYDVHTAQLAKAHNRANVIAIGGRTTTLKSAIKMIEAFANADFEPRHQHRIDKINHIEGD